MAIRFDTTDFVFSHGANPRGFGVWVFGFGGTLDCTDTWCAPPSTSIHQTKIPTLSLVPSHILLSNTDIELTTAIDHREARLKTELDKVCKRL